MPRFHFHTSNGQVHLDPEGVELADVEQARTQAVRYTGQHLSDHPDHLAGPLVVSVTDDWGITLFVISVTFENLTNDSSLATALSG